MCLRAYYSAQEVMQGEEDNTCFPSAGKQMIHRPL